MSRKAPDMADNLYQQKRLGGPILKICPGSFNLRQRYGKRISEKCRGPLNWKNGNAKMSRKSRITFSRKKTSRGVVFEENVLEIETCNHVTENLFRQNVLET